MKILYSSWQIFQIRFQKVSISRKRIYFSSHKLYLKKMIACKLHLLLGVMTSSVVVTHTTATQFLTVQNSFAPDCGDPFYLSCSQVICLRLLCLGPMVVTWSTCLPSTPKIRVRIRLLFYHVKIPL